MRRLILISLFLTACLPVIRPTNASADPGLPIRFVLSAALGAPPVVWTATSGSIAADGTFTAPPCSSPLPVTVTIAATSGSDTVTTTVLVEDRITSIDVSPKTVTLAPGQSQKFTATIKTVCTPAGTTVSRTVSKPAIASK